MAVYGTLSQVEDVLPEGVKIDSQTTEKPNRTTVTTILGRNSARLEVALQRGGYTLPVTDAAMLSALEGLNVNKTAYDILVTRAHRNDSKNPALWIEWNKEFNEALKAMSEGKWAAPDGSGSLPYSPTMDADHEISDASKNPRIHGDLDL